MKTIALDKLGAYCHTAYMLRPVSRSLVEEYATAMKTGITFPPVIVGDFPSKEGVRAQLLVDGMHRYRAALEAKLSKLPVEVIHYETEALALADQLKRNMAHGQRVDAAHRDARIRQLVEIFKWKTRQVAKEVGLHHSSVSRIMRHKQAGGKPGPKGPTRAVVAPSKLTPRKFLKEVGDIHLTMLGPSQQQLVVALYDPKLPKEERTTMLKLLMDTGHMLVAFVQQHLNVLEVTGETTTTS